MYPSMLRKLSSFVPYERWYVKVARGEDCKMSGIYNSELEARTELCEWYYKTTRYRLSYAEVVKSLDDFGYFVGITCV